MLTANAIRFGDSSGKVDDALARLVDGQSKVIFLFFYFLDVSLLFKKDD
jgi:hypothetical protein